VLWKVHSKDHAVAASSSHVHAGDELDDRDTPLSGTQLDERSVFAKYTPLLREIDSAGWEVVTRARSSNPDVWVERFGSLSDDGGVWLPVHNPTDIHQAYTMTVEGSAVGGLSASDLQGEDRITGTPVVVTPSDNGSGVSFAGTLKPHTTALVRLRQIRP
jgi:hypothetical protein